MLKNKSIQFTVMSAIASGINFITLIVFGRIFDVEEYGIVTALQAFVANVGVFMIPLQILVCRTIAGNSESKSNEINSIISIVMLATIIEFAGITIFSPFLMSYLNCPNVCEYIIFVFLLLINNIFIFFNGISQGIQDFFILGITNILLYAIKMIIGVTLGHSGIGPVAAIIGYAIAELVCIILIFYRIKKHIVLYIKNYKKILNINELKEYLLSFILYMIVSIYMNNGDILIAKAYCNDTEIGLYSVIINLSKISVFLIATPVATVLLPKVSSCANNIRIKFLLKAEGVTVIAALLYGIVMYVFGRWFVLIMYGSEYADSAKYILPCIFFSVSLSLFWVFYQYAFASGLTKVFTIVSCLVGVTGIVVILLSRCSISMISIIMSISMIVIMSVVSVYIKCISKGK